MNSPRLRWPDARLPDDDGPRIDVDQLLDGITDDAGEMSDFLAMFADLGCELHHPLTPRAR